MVGVISYVAGDAGVGRHPNDQALALLRNGPGHFGTRGQPLERIAERHPRQKHRGVVDASSLPFEDPLGAAAHAGDGRRLPVIERILVEELAAEFWKNSFAMEFGFAQQIYGPGSPRRADVGSGCWPCKEDRRRAWLRRIVVEAALHAAGSGGCLLDGADYRAGDENECPTGTFVVFKTKSVTTPPVLDGIEIQSEAVVLTGIETGPGLVTIP